MSNQSTNKGAGAVETIIVFLFIGAGLVLLKVLKTGTNKASTDLNTINELSKTISSEMSHSLSYLTHDWNVLRNFILTIALGSLISFICAVYSFSKRKKNLRIPKVTRKIAYSLSILTFIAAIVFLIWHNSFFVSRDLRNMLENINTTPEVILPGESFEVSVPNKSGIESIDRNYKVLNYAVNKSEAKLQNDSILPFKISKIEARGKWEEMKTRDVQAKIFPEFSIILPSDSRLNGTVVNMEISLTANIPYFPEGSSGYLLKDVSMKENLSFRVATPSEASFYNECGKFIGIIWYTLGGCLLFFILTMSFAGNSYYKAARIQT